MRRILVIVLLALLPLQWSGAAAAVRCLHGEAGHAHGERADAVRDGRHAMHAAHAAHAAHGPEAMRTVHGDPMSHDAHPGHADAAAHAGMPHSGLGDCGLGDCGGCCHGTGTAPPAAQPLPLSPVFGAVPASRIDATPASPTLDGPFRPPRAASA